jgi:alpha-L-fucosidase
MTGARFVATNLILVGLALTSSRASSQESTLIEYSTTHEIDAQDSPAMVVEKAAKTLPRPNQTAWMRLERTFFLHFGPNTFRGVEWVMAERTPPSSIPRLWTRISGCAP